jgi:hypothetical protein
MTTLTEATFRLTGNTPLLMHNVRMANPLNEFARAVKELTGRQKGMDPDEFAAEKSRLQFLGGLYWDEEVGLHMPGYNIFRCFMEGGAMQRGNGVKVERALTIFPRKCAIQPWTDKFDDPEDLFRAGHYHMTMVKPTSASTVPATRPKFDSWVIDFPFSLDESIIDVTAVLAAAEAAGRFKGLGDGRKKGYGMGRFYVERVA